MMKHAALALFLLAAPLNAQQALPPEDGTPGALAEGVQSLLRGLFQDLDPALRGLHEGAEKLGPLLSRLAGLISDVQHYELPERLPNGDILLRRKADAPPPPPLSGPGDDDSLPRNADGSVDL